MFVRSAIHAAAVVAAAAALFHPGNAWSEQTDLGREVLAPNDGWASLGLGTTGGSAATPERTHVVTNRAELVAALAFPDPTPKIVYIDRTIEGNVDDNDEPLTCEDYYRPDPQTGTPYTLEDFLAFYDPNGPWGRVNPSGPLERGRVASAAAQQARVRIRIPANTTIVGIGKKAEVRGAWFDIRPSSTSGTTRMNVIIRNITFQDSTDCFPQWAPNDGALGNWNALYDGISVRNASHVWIDHNTFRDKFSRDETLPIHFGRIYQVHDGHVDITNESDLVTVSWNSFETHDKTMLIGSSDGATADRNKLRTTIHHNLFDGLGQRVPRVRFGQVHVFNNYYKFEDVPNFGYAWGVGRESQIHAENNMFKADDAITPDLLIEVFTGTQIFAAGNHFGGTPSKYLFDPVAAYNAVNDPDLLPTVAWTPTLFTEIEATKKVPSSVQNKAGPQNW